MVDRNNITHVGLQVMLDYDTSRLIWLSLCTSMIVNSLKCNWQQRMQNVIQTRFIFLDLSVN